MHAYSNEKIRITKGKEKIMFRVNRLFSSLAHLGSRHFIWPIRFYYLDKNRKQQGLN
jgi:hypothetical protein